LILLVLLILVVISNIKSVRKSRVKWSDFGYSQTILRFLRLFAANSKKA
jgi:hypothetical protein